jgi:hypothetical protein
MPSAAQGGRSFAHCKNLRCSFTFPLGASLGGANDHHATASEIILTATRFGHDQKLISL